MSLELILGMSALFGMAAIGTPVAYAILVGVLVYLAASGQDLAIAGTTMVQRLFDGFLLLAVPLFIASANIMNAGTISDRLLQFCIALVGRFRGGMGHVNVVASLIFSGMSGSAVADAAGIGKIIIDMMVKSGRYTRGYAAAITAATATIGPIIPPSIPMVLYALVSNASVGDLFLADRAGACDGRGADGYEYSDLASAWIWPRRPRATSRTAQIDDPCDSRIVDARDFVGVYLLWRDHPDRSCGHCGALRADRGSGSLSGNQGQNTLPNFRRQRAFCGFCGPCYRRVDDPDLYRYSRKHPADDFRHVCWRRHQPTYVHLVGEYSGAAA